MDVLIVGSGLAALQTANRLSRSKNVMLITKTRYHNNSNMAQGGVAAVFLHQKITGHRITKIHSLPAATITIKLQYSIWFRKDRKKSII
ncbi:hypothetical protein GCM10020331_035300 [Ectobacillus funiculus]